METEFNFNSQVCTSKVQSERLLALGLKKETADMNYTRLSKGDHWTLFIGLPMGYDEIPNEYLLPAWSLHRLVSLTNTDDIKIAYNEKSCWGGKVLKIALRKAFVKDNLYDNIIDCIEWLIKKGYFNKEYLV